MTNSTTAPFRDTPSPVAVPVTKGSSSGPCGLYFKSNVQHPADTGTDAPLPFSIFCVPAKIAAPEETTVRGSTLKSSGILMTELSYYLNDLLFEDRPWNRDTRHFITDYDVCWQFGIRSGGSILSRINKNADGWNANAKPAYSIGVTATYMPECIGATLYTGLTQIQWTGDDRLTLLDGEWFHDLPMAGAGITADIPLSARMSLSGQAIAGYGIGDYDYHLLSEDLTPVDFSIKAGARMIADLGITVRTASDNSMTFFSGIDSYSGIWTAWTAGARFNLLF